MQWVTKVADFSLLVIFCNDLLKYKTKVLTAAHWELFWFSTIGLACVWNSCKFSTESVTKEFWKSVNIGPKYGEEFHAVFFLTHSVYRVCKAEVNVILSIVIVYFVSAQYLFHTVFQKIPTLLLSISLPNINRISKLFYWHTLRKICNKVIIKYPTTR